jgi:hypothetical protein
MQRNDITPRVEYAAFQTGDFSLRQRLRGAPPAIRKNIDAARKAQGLAPLWGKATPAPKPAARKAPKPPAPVVATIVVALAPGLSAPVTTAGEAPNLPEMISQRGWRAVAKQLAAGKALPIVTAHRGGELIGYTVGPRFRFRVCPTVGGIIELDVRATDPAMPSGSGCSITFYAKAVRKEMIGKQLVRVIDDLELVHIALIRAGSLERPAYAIASARRCKPAQASATVADLRIDIGRRILERWPTLPAVAKR